MDNATSKPVNDAIDKNSDQSEDKNDRIEMEPDSTTVNSQNSKESHPDSTTGSKHSKEVLISGQQDSKEVKDDSNLGMFPSCAQLLLGVVLVVFGVLVRLHGASLGGSGAGLWAGAAALAAGALGIVATLTTPKNKSDQISQSSNSGFATAHLATSLIALALSNMASLTALTAVVRDAQRAPDPELLNNLSEDSSAVGVDPTWAGLLASIGLLIASIFELLISGYTCFKLTPKLCDCLKPSSPYQGKLKTSNMVHQWVSSHPKMQPIYIIQPMMPVQPIMQAPYAIPPRSKKYSELIPTTGTFPRPSMYHSMPPTLEIPTGLPCSPHPRYHPQMIRIKRKRYGVSYHEPMSLPNQRTKPEFHPVMSKTMPTKPKPIQATTQPVDLAQTYTGLDKKMSEEFISIAMDPEKKSKALSSLGSELSSAPRKPSEVAPKEEI